MKSMMKIFIVLCLLALVSGCSSISKTDAEAKSLAFVNENVKFFSKEGDSTLNLPQYSIDSMTSYQEGKDWVVIIHITADVANETKKNDLVVRVNNKGQVSEFNGQKVQN